MVAPILERRELNLIAKAAADCGLPKLGIVRLDHPGFERARESYDQFLERGKAGEMGYLERTHAVRKYPESMLQGAKSVFVVAIPYRGHSGPIARYAQSKDYHSELHQRLQRLDDKIKEIVPGISTMACVDTKPVLERSAALLSGLGFLGKNGCIIVPGLGSYVLLAELLSTAQWNEADSPISLDLTHQRRSPWQACGNCTRCLEACPTEAFDAPGQLDPRRCISYLTLEHRGAIAPSLAERMGVRVAGCDVCQEVCPYNHSPTREERVPFAVWLPYPKEQAIQVDLSTLAVIGNNQHKRWSKGTALSRIPRLSLRRNVIIALANKEDPLTSSESNSLNQCRLDPNTDIQKLAEWALQKHRSKSSDEPRPDADTKVVSDRSLAIDDESS